MPIPNTRYSAAPFRQLLSDRCGTFDASGEGLLVQPIRNDGTPVAAVWSVIRHASELPLAISPLNLECKPNVISRKFRRNKLLPDRRKHIVTVVLIPGERDAIRARISRSP
jgi:hypothetical protein